MERGSLSWEERVIQAQELLDEQERVVREKYSAKRGRKSNSPKEIVRTLNGVRMSNAEYQREMKTLRKMVREAQANEDYSLDDLIAPVGRPVTKRYKIVIETKD